MAVEAAQRGFAARGRRSAFGIQLLNQRLSMSLTCPTTPDSVPKRHDRNRRGSQKLSCFVMHALSNAQARLWSGTWRRHSCLQRRDSSRRFWVSAGKDSAGWASPQIFSTRLRTPDVVEIVMSHQQLSPGANEWAKVLPRLPGMAQHILPARQKLGATSGVRSLGTADTSVCATSRCRSWR